MKTRSFFIIGFATIALIVLSTTWVYFAVNDSAHIDAGGSIILLTCLVFLVWTALLLNREKSM